MATSTGVRIKNKTGYTPVSLELVRDNSLSLTAKGLYLSINTFITTDNTLGLEEFVNEQLETNEHDFLKAFNELKSKGLFFEISDLIENNSQRWDK